MTMASNGSVNHAPVFVVHASVHMHDPIARGQYWYDGSNRSANHYKASSNRPVEDASVVVVAEFAHVNDHVTTRKHFHYPFGVSLRCICDKANQQRDGQ